MICIKINIIVGEPHLKLLRNVITLRALPSSSLIAVSNGGVDSLIPVLGRLEDQSEGSILRVDKGLDSITVGNELYLVQQPLDVRHRVAAHLALQLDGRSLHGLGRPEEGSELRLLHRLADRHGARGLGLADLVDALGREGSCVRHLALLDHQGGAAAGVLGDKNT
jgi:hypothetical protein